MVRIFLRVIQAMDLQVIQEMYRQGKDLRVWDPDLQVQGAREVLLQVQVTCLQEVEE